MNPKLAALLLCASLVPAVQANAKTILPDACGDDSVKFNVKTEKNQPAPAPPAAGKAQIIFVNDAKGWSARYGMDGAWVGANDGDSYFAVTVDPGEHHLCADYHVSAAYLGSLKEKNMLVATVTAEAGKIYYFQSTVGATGGGGGYVPPTMGANGQMSGGRMVGGGGGSTFFGFGMVDDDTGKFRVKAWKLATWKTK
ncbi:MAG: hypothetical protein ABSD67_05540 [Terracidiphilus sp.]|jgi:hypothetical protein